MGRGRRKNKTCSVVPSASSGHLSESKPPSSPLACLICYCHTRVLKSSVVQFYGFILVPITEARNCDGVGDGEGFMPLSPRFRLDGLDMVQFCIANSILYVFEECDFSDIRKSVYSFDLSVVLNDSSTEMVVIEKGMLEKCSEMKSPKARANAILTPKGKILIFSPVTAPVGYYKEFDFELFDPDTKQCRSLPQLPSTTSMLIHGYGFLSDAMFMISTDRGKYAFDLDRNNGWEEHFRYPYTPLSYFIGFGNEICSANGFVRIQHSYATPLSRFDPPLSRLPDSVWRRFSPEQFDNRSSSICLLGAEKELILSIAQVAFVDDERNDRPYILFDVYQSDLTRKRKASFRFTAGIPGDLVTFLSCGLFRAV